MLKYYIDLPSGQPDLVRRGKEMASVLLSGDNEHWPELKAKREMLR